MNIDNPSQVRACTSCQICAAVCPVSAISIKLNEQGFYRPYIDSNLCIDCSLCVKSCYKFDNDIKITDSLNSKSIFAAWAKDPNIVSATTSGGIADILAEELLIQGYKCIGVEYDAVNNCASGKIASTLDEVRTFRGSKYIQSLSVNAFRSLVKEQTTQKYAVFGLPCQIYAVDRLLRSRGTRERHILIDLYCHGCPTLNLWKKYLKETLAKVNGKNVISANFRSKVRGWGNFYVVVLVVEGVKHPIKIVSHRINDPFYELFFSDKVLNDSCPDCQLRSTLEYTDIRLGDFWGRSFIINNKGISGVTICSESAKSLFEKIKPCINYTAQSFDNFLPYQSYGKKYMVDALLRTELLKELATDEIPLSYSIRTYRKSMTATQKAKRLLKNLINCLPDKIISYSKYFFYSIK